MIEQDGLSALETGGQSLIDGRYRLLAKLGAGTTGIVFKGCDLELEQQIVAIKLLYPHLVQGAASIAQFKREVLITQRLSHPCIVQTYRFLQTPEGEAALVMEHVDGRSLRCSLDGYSDGLPVSKLIEVLFAIACGLECSHSLGVLHRDLKPDNILIAANGVAKIADFGLAQNLRASGQLHATTVGTPYYMAPELFHGEVADGSSDVYSFGVMAFELASGQLPYRSQSLLELAVAHSEAPLPSLKQIRQDLPQWLCELIARCCDKSRSRRPAISEIISILEEQAATIIAPLTRLHTPSDAQAAASGEVAIGNEPVRSHPFILLLLLCLLLALLGLVIVPRIFNSVTWRHAAAVGRMEYYLGVRLPFLYQAMGVHDPIHDPELSLRSDRMGLWVPLFAGADPNYRASDGKQPLQRVMSTSRSSSFQNQSVEYLLEFGAEVDGQDSRGRSALWYAVGARNIGIVERLLEYGADPNLADDELITPLHRAVETRHSGILFLLLRHGASAASADTKGDTPMHFAARQCNELMLKALLTKSAVRKFATRPDASEQSLLDELSDCRDGEESRRRSEAIIRSRFEAAR